MFELKDVEIIREVVRCGGFRAAAQKLRLSQSAVSTRVSEAEQRIGVELLDRKRHGARLTPLGRRFLDQAERLLEMRDQIASSLHPSSGFAGTIRIGAAESIVHILLPDMLRGIRNVFPDARLELSVDLSPVLSRRLSAEEIDVAILVSQLVPAGEINMPLFSCELDWFASSSMTLPTHPLTLEELAQHSIVTFLKGSIPYIEVERVFADPTLPSPLLSGCASVATMIHLVSDGFGIGLLPSLLAQSAVEAGRIVRLRTTPQARVRTLEFSFACLSRRNSRQMEQIRECAQKAALIYGSER
jgi:DNA-binding transcriptional LysR family regulator